MNHLVNQICLKKLIQLFHIAFYLFQFLHNLNLQDQSQLLHFVCLNLIIDLISLDKFVVNILHDFLLLNFFVLLEKIDLFVQMN